MKVLSIDASINNVGWCQFNTDSFRHALKGGRIQLQPQDDDDGQFASIAKAKKLAWSWGTFELEGGSKQMRFMDLVQQIVAQINPRFDYLITEQPAFYSSEKGAIAARQNYTIDLASCNYFVAGWLHMDHRCHHPITAITWKGSVPKIVTQKAFFRTFGEQGKGISEHAIDATMLLHYWLKTWAMVSPQVARHTSAELIQVLL